MAQDDQQKGAPETEGPHGKSEAKEEDGSKYGGDSRKIDRCGAKSSVVYRSFHKVQFAG